MRNRNYKAKRCPRCQTKNHYSAFKCTECGLIFSRVQNGSNKLAKQLILAKKKDETVCAPGYPKDVSKKKFLLLCIFAGIFGAHNFYVGRFVKAFLQLIVGILSIVAVAISGNTQLYNTIFSFVSVPIGVFVVIWACDIWNGVFNKYKIPVAVDFKNIDKI